MALVIPGDEIIWLLHSIEVGFAKLTPEQEPQDVYAGVVAYTASNELSIAVFNDANEWDYLEWMQAPDGRCVRHDDFPVMFTLANHELPANVAWKRYGIPGYMKFRCTRLWREY